MASAVPGYLRLPSLRLPTLSRSSAENPFQSIIAQVTDARGNVSRFDASSRAELNSLAQERDPEMFFSGLLAFGTRQEQAGNIDAAAQIYSTILRRPEASQTGVLRRAQDQLNAVLGQGSAGLRAEFLFRRLAQETCEPSSLLAMGAAGTVFRATRLAVLGRLMASPEGGFLTRGLGARALASLSAFALEAPAFTLTGHLAQSAVGHRQDWSSFGRDLASSYLVLGGLRLSGALGEGILQRWGLSQGLAPTLVGQASMLGGIMLGRHLEERLALRPQRDGATLFTDSLVTLLQFNAAGRLSGEILGERVSSWERGVELRTQLLQSVPRPSRWGNSLGPRFAPASAAVAPAHPETVREPLEAESNNVFMMGGRGGDKGSSSKLDDSGLRVIRGVQSIVVPEGADIWPHVRKWIEAQTFPIIVGEMVWGLDLSRVKMINDAFRRQIGWEEGELSGKSVRRIFHSLTDAFVGARVTLLKSGEFSPTRMRLKMRDDSPIWCVGAGMIREIQGKKIAFGIFSDFPGAETAAGGTTTPKPPSGVRSVAPPSLESNEKALEHFRNAQAALGLDPDRKKPQ